jgi:hypothetical protein
MRLGGFFKQARMNLYGPRGARATAEPPAPSARTDAYEQFAATVIHVAGSELLRAATALEEAAQALKFAGKLKASNETITAARRARDAGQGLV